MPNDTRPNTRSADADLLGEATPLEPPQAAQDVAATQSSVPAGGRTPQAPGRGDGAGEPGRDENQAGFLRERDDPLE